MLTTYLASTGRGTLAAFIATLPLLTGLSFMLIYIESGKAEVEDYGRGLLIFTSPWLCYVATVIIGVERLGIFKAVALGFAVYIVLSSLFQFL